MFTHKTGFGPFSVHAYRQPGRKLPSAGHNVTQELGAALGERVIVGAGLIDGLNVGTGLMVGT